MVVPPGGRAFQFTSKHVALPVRGCLVVDRMRHDLGADAFAALDFGRGVWPRATTWNWAAAAGRVGDAVVGLNLGGRWTRGSGVTEKQRRVIR